jgi:NAD-dependent SIR2 family protein deacetylase
MSLYLCRAKWLETTYDNEGFRNDEPNEHDEIRIVEAENQCDAAKKFSQNLRINIWCFGESHGEEHWNHAEAKINEVIK